MLKFVAYLRVSTASQGSSGLGIEAQRETIRAYAAKEGWTQLAEVVEIESGKRADRPELARAFALSRLHRCPTVVAKVDRLTRSSAFLHRALDANVDVRFADLPEIGGPTGRFMLTQLAAVAELEAGMISVRTRAALKAAQARGVKLGGNRGYKQSAASSAHARAVRTAMAHDRANDVLPTIRQLQMDGFASLAAIAAELTRQSIPTATGGAMWSKMGVSRVLARA